MVKVRLQVDSAVYPRNLCTLAHRTSQARLVRHSLLSGLLCTVLLVRCANKY